MKNKFLLSLTAFFIMSCSENNIVSNVQESTSTNDIFMFSTEKPTLPKVDKVKKSIIMGYWALDSNLDPVSETHLPDIESVGSNENLNLVLLLDKQNLNTRTYFLDKIDSSYVNLKEKNMSDPKELESFVSSSLKNYPAFIKILDIASHGYGYKGFIVDMDPVKNSIMPIDKFALSIRKALNGKKLDLINVLACLMSNIEFMNEIKDLSNYVIASQDVTYGGEIIAYKKAYSSISKGDDNVEKVIRKFVDTASKIKSKTTMAGIDLRKINNVTSSINKLSLVLIDKLNDPIISEKILMAYNDTNAPIESLLEKLPSRDIISFCNNLKLINDVEIKNASMNVISSLKGSFIINKSYEGKNANGMSIYMPLLDHYQELDKEYHNLKFAKETKWLNFIDKLSKMPNESKYVALLKNKIDTNKDSILSSTEMNKYFGYEIENGTDYQKFISKSVIRTRTDISNMFVYMTRMLSSKNIPIDYYLKNREENLKGIDLSIPSNKTMYDFHKKTYDFLSKNSLSFDKNKNSHFDFDEFVAINLEAYYF